MNSVGLIHFTDEHTEEITYYEKYTDCMVIYTAHNKYYCGSYIEKIPGTEYLRKKHIYFKYEDKLIDGRYIEDVAEVYNIRHIEYW